MYLDSNSPIPNGQRSANCKAKASDLRLAETQDRVNKGRFALYNTTPSVCSLAKCSPELAANGAQILQQSAAGRASVLGAGTPAGVIQQQVPTFTPRVEPLNTRGDLACSQQSKALVRRPVVEVQRATMPKAGPMLISGKIRDVAPRRGGLSGVAPPWGDAAVVPSNPVEGFIDWVKAHPWLSLAVAGGVVVLATDERRRSRRGY